MRRRGVGPKVEKEGEVFSVEPDREGEKVGGIHAWCAHKIPKISDW